MKASVQTILQLGLDPYLSHHRLPPFQRQAALALLHCRTAVLGGHTEECPEGHVARVWYNSCRHRSCPQCAFLKTQEWLEKKEQQLLPCDHYHVIFTLPSELRILWRWNQPELADLLFHVVRDTLFTLLEDPKHLGARPGVLAALHTWGRTLVLHPHLHCLVTGGGLSPAGTWKSVRGGFLLPAAVVRIVYRGKMLQALEKLLRAGRLQRPPDLTLEGALKLLRQAARKKWNVRIQERYEHGRGVATYLARYLRGGPLKNHRIVRCDAQSVTFRYGDHRQADAAGRAPNKVMTLPMEELLSRLLVHVPLPGMHVVRGYGLYSRTDHKALERSREQLQAPPHPPDKPSELARRTARPPREASVCPVCGRPLVRREELPRSGKSPPAAVDPSRRVAA